MSRGDADRPKTQMNRKRTVNTDEHGWESRYRLVSPRLRGSVEERTDHKRRSCDRMRL